MRQPRCGVADKQSKSVVVPQNFITIGRKWPNKIITWNTNQYTQQLPESEQRAAFENAFQYWSKVSPLRFEETSKDADINIAFGKGDHGDGAYNHGRGVLAHEAWTYLREGTELKTVAAHEFGHVLGLAHSNETDSIMAPFYKGYDPQMNLHQDDIDGIQSLYGKPEETKTTSSTEASISSTETTATTRVPCDLKVDAITDGRKWPNKIITWNTNQYTQQLPESEQRAAFENAFQYWSKVSPLRFEETSKDADINIAFGKGDHGDGAYNHGRGVLAHEAWTYLREGTELKTVAAHEFGHVLGLAHSNETDSIMAPFYKGYDPQMNLHQDDIDGIQSLYGKPEETKTTSSTEASISSTETTATTRVPCDLKVDAITDGPDGYVYFFRRGNVYKMGSDGLVLPGFPRRIRSIFPEGPAKNVGSAFYISSENQMVFLKGNKSWSFKGFTLEKRFNISISAQAAIAVRRTGSYTHQVYLFQGENFYELNYKTLDLIPGFPLSTKTYWTGMPLNTEAGMQLKDNNLLLFKGYKYSIFDTASRRILPGYPKPIVEDWLGQTC